MAPAIRKREGASPNATQSGTSDKGLPAVGGDRALARVVAHLDLHGARVGSLRPARRENESQDLRAQPAQPLGDGARAVEAGVEPGGRDEGQAHQEADASRRGGSSCCDDVPFMQKKVVERTA